VNLNFTCIVDVANNSKAQVGGGGESAKKTGWALGWKTVKNGYEVKLGKKVGCLKKGLGE